MNSFLETFIPKAAVKTELLNKAIWLLETTGSKDAADLKSALDTDVRILYSDPSVYRKLLEWDQDPSIHDPQLKRQLNVLIRSFKQNILPETLLSDLSKKEAALALSFAAFRAKVDGKELSDNEIRNILKHENDVSIRKKTWEASKEIGEVLAPQILHLVAIRNQGAKILGYSNYFEQQLKLQEVDGKKLFETLNRLSDLSEKAYENTLQTIQKEQSKRFGVPAEELGPWAWSEPFCQEDPLTTEGVETLIESIDVVEASVAFFKRMGIDITPTLQKSDMFERENKNQHAFCINIDRKSDVRTLNNVKPTLKWLETVLHEFGHAIYDLGIDPKLPWALREPPHMITTEAMALIAGRMAYTPETFHRLTGATSRSLLDSLKRRQLIFSRWVLVMTYFEQELYSNPGQDLNALWWSLIAKYQKINVPKNRSSKKDWAAKYHIGGAPVYYYSYLLGEMFASQIADTLLKETGSATIDQESAGKLLQERLFSKGNSMKWDALVQHVTGKELGAESWISQFA
jgi:peptidyl-dipeptidase A